MRRAKELAACSDGVPSTARSRIRQQCPLGQAFRSHLSFAFAAAANPLCIPQNCGAVATAADDQLPYEPLYEAIMREAAQTRSYAAALSVLVVAEGSVSTGPPARRSRCPTMSCK